jgi:glycosyltransferase involved in cell wall biosynthesis
LHERQVELPNMLGRTAGEVRGPVLLVGNFLSATLGGNSVCEDLAERLVSLGWPVLTTSSQPARLSRLCDMLITVLRQRHSYRVAHVDVYSGPAFLWAEAVCRTLQLIKKPYVLTLHGGNLPAFARRWPGRVRRLLLSAAAVTTPSRFLLEEIAPYRSDLRLQPNPLETNSYTIRLRGRPQPRLVWLRALHSVYNPTLAARVVALLAADFPDIELTMIGRDKGDGCLQIVQQTAIELGVADRISFPGKVPRAAVADWLDKADIFLNTAEVDNTPLSVMEAMASGMCIVSTNVGGIPYLLEHDADALLVPPRDEVAMAAAVRRVLTEPGLAERLSRNAHQKAKQFDWSIVLPQWDELLLDTMSKERNVRTR